MKQAEVQLIQHNSTKKKTPKKQKTTHQARCRSVWECPRWTRRRSCAVARGRAACSPSGGTTEPPLWFLGAWGLAGVASGPKRPGWRASPPPLAEATTKPTTFQCKTVPDKSFPSCSDLVRISAPTAFWFNVGTLLTAVICLQNSSRNLVIITNRGRIRMHSQQIRRCKCFLFIASETACGLGCRRSSTQPVTTFTTDLSAAKWWDWLNFLVSIDHVKLWQPITSRGELTYLLCELCANAAFYGGWWWQGWQSTTKQNKKKE